MKEHLHSNQQRASRWLISSYALLWYLHLMVSIVYFGYVLITQPSESYPIHYAWMFAVGFLLLAQVKLFWAVATSHSIFQLVRAVVFIIAQFGIIHFAMKTHVDILASLALITTATLLGYIAWNLRFLPSVNDQQSLSPRSNNEAEGKRAITTTDQEEASKIKFYAYSSNVTFKDIRGMSELKMRLKKAASEIVALQKNVKPRNGILLNGQPGNGKTFFVEALAGEMGLPLISVTYGDVASKWVNETTQNVMKVFQDARAQAPCFLFLDEIDSLIKDRNSGDGSNEEAIKTTNTILTEIVNLRKHGIVLLGATNFLEKLDAAAVREGRFDYKIEITPPDEEGRFGILLDSVLKNVPAVPFSDSSLRRLSKRWVGYSVKRIQSVGEELGDMERECPMEEIDSDNLQIAMRRIQGRKGSIPESTKKLSQLFFNDELKRNLLAISSRMNNSERIEEMGGTVPSGLLFFGEPGTGKTETARALAKETSYAFLGTSGNDLIMKPNEIDRILAEARDIRPCIVFIDEADDILANRQSSNVTTITNKLLTAMDGSGGKIPDILFIAATNHPDHVDPAALRGGRFTEKMFFELPSMGVMTLFTNEWISNSRAKFSLQLSPEVVAGEIGAGVSIANAIAILQGAVNQMIERSAMDGHTEVVLNDLRLARKIID
jgi:transitional endoplasmic reticulum ATPase